MRFLAVTLFILTISITSQAYFIAIDANEEKCFFERVNAGTKMGLMFEVAEGGFLDIDVVVSPPFKLILYNDRESRLRDRTTKKSTREFVRVPANTPSLLTWMVRTLTASATRCQP